MSGSDAPNGMQRNGYVEWRSATPRSACKPFYSVIWCRCLFGDLVSLLQELKQASSLRDVAGILGYKPSALSFLLYKLHPNLKYTTFSIPKKDGGSRKIDAPAPKIKKLQRKLADTLYECNAEIEAANKPQRSLSHAFRKSHSIITNASQHKSRRYVLNLDL
jgi:RNA-directed DNA polymerase